MYISKVILNTFFWWPAISSFYPHSSKTVGNCSEMPKQSFTALQYFFISSSLLLLNPAPTTSILNPFFYVSLPISPLLSLSIYLLYLFLTYNSRYSCEIISITDLFTSHELQSPFIFKPLCSHMQHGFARYVINKRQGFITYCI